MNTSNDYYTACNSCGQKTPKENLNCVYCGEVIYTTRGFFNVFHSPKGKKILMIIAVLVLFAFFFICVL